MPAQAAAGLGEAALLTRPDHPYRTTVARLGLALLAMQQGNLEAVREQYHALKSAPSMMLVLISTDRVRGLLSRAMGDPDQAIAHFEDAITFCRQTRFRSNLAWSCCDYTDALLKRNNPGDGEKAISLLDEALKTSQILGMSPLTKRVIARQEQAQSRPRRDPGNPGGLSHREVEVLRLISTGKTDREIAEELFISPLTVGNHVKNILNKTNTSNRTEAATYAAHQGLT